MTATRRSVVAFTLGLAVLASYARALDRVPFHPDESSWIHMSRDFDALARRDLGRLVWWSGEQASGDVGFRLLDAPLAKYQIGLARWLSGHPEEPNANWSWLLSRASNEAAGAMPSPEALHRARLSAVVAAALFFACFFWVASEIVGTFPAAAAALLLATQPLELLHVRRAMAESTAQLFLMLAILAIVRLTLSARRDGRARRWRWSVVAGIAVGLAVAAKQSAIAIAPLAALAAAAVVAVPPASNGAGRAGGAGGAGRAGRASRRVDLQTLTDATLNAGTLVVASLLTFFVVNPVLYSQPLHAGRVMISVRRTLTRNQAASLATVGSRQALPTTLSRLNAAYRQVFWYPPEPFESASDAEADRGARDYEPRPLTLMWNWMWFRLSFLLFSGLGLGIAARTIVRFRFGPATWTLQIVVLWLLVEIAFVTVFISMDWQRYFLPLLPPVCIFAALGASWLVDVTCHGRGRSLGTLQNYL